MNGVEHFKKAEDYLAKAGNAKCLSPEESFYLEMAQVHATLAVAASQLRSLPAEQADNPTMPI